LGVIERTRRGTSDGLYTVFLVEPNQMNAEQREADSGKVAQEQILCDIKSDAEDEFPQAYILPQPRGRDLSWV
jgi:hypothetical protein